MLRGFAIFALLVLIGIPLVLRADRESPADSANRVIIITPHNEQIRYEFGRGFARWHEKEYGEPATVIWSSPGGTSEIRKLLQSLYAEDLASDREPGGSFDLVFGGGSVEYEQFKKSDAVKIPSGKTCSLTVAVDFPVAWLDRTYGDNEIGSSRLFDPEKKWFGTALSGFGIVFNRDALKETGAREPEVWLDLCQPRLFGWVALGNPAQSGSIQKSFDIVLQRHGWQEGWQVLRRAAGNARYFSASATKVPIDVSMGEAAAGVSIDFYGRYQSQSAYAAGRSDRVGYVDPPGLSAIDPDPIAMLRGAPNPVIAERFMRFCLSDEGQALWQFRPDSSAAAALGPHQFELRRLPIRRSLYASHFEQFVDRVNPFELAKPLEENRQYWRFIPIVFTAAAIENHPAMKAAWKAIIEHPAYPRDRDGIVSAADVEDSTLRRMLALFDAMPEAPALMDGASEPTALSLADPTNLPKVTAAMQDRSLWHVQTTPEQALRRQFSRFFRDNYAEIVKLAEE